jgi:hypothetical protein
MINVSFVLLAGESAGQLQRWCNQINLDLILRQENHYFRISKNHLIFRGELILDMASVYYKIVELKRFIKIRKPAL